MFKRPAFILLVSCLMVWSLFPLWYALVASLSTDTELYIPHYLPPGFYFGNFADLFDRSFVPHGMVNSALVGTAALLLSLTLGLMASYPLALFAFPGRRALLWAVLATSLFPPVAVLAGAIEMIRALGLYNTLSAVVLTDLLFVLPFSTWFLTAALAAIPREIEDMAVIDGAGPARILLQIFLPLAWPAVAASGLLGFIALWNEFLFAFTFTLTPDTRTAPVALATLWGKTPHDLPWGSLMAACLLMTLPVAVLVWLFQRRIVAGLTAGAING